jgi:hypothetical protein
MGRPVPHRLQSLVDELSQLLASVATLEDRDFNLVAFSSQTGDLDSIRQQSILQRSSSGQVRSWFEQFGIATANGPVRTPANPVDGIVGRLCLPARWRGVHYGYFWFLDERGGIDDDLLPTAMSIASRAGAALAQQWRTRQDVELSLQALLGPDLDLVEQAAGELEDLNLIRRNTPVVALMCSLDPGRGRPEAINVWRLPSQILVTTGVEGALSAVIPLRSVDDLSPALEAASRIRELVGERQDSTNPWTVAIGLGAARPDLRQVRGSWLEAKLAATAGGSDLRLSPVARWSELGVYRLLACGPRAALKEAVLDPAVVRLLEQPSDDLVTTAAVYLDHAGNVQKTAAELRVHRQTLYYRLKRVEEVTGLDLTLGRDRLVLHLGLTLASSLGAGRSSDRGP